MTKRLFDKIDKDMAKQVKKNKFLLDNGTIEPLTKDYQYATNGTYFLCAKMGGGKSYFIMKHILITEQLFDEPYYDTIIFCSTSEGLDNTVKAQQSLVKTPIINVNDKNLMTILRKHLDNKIKYYAVMAFIESGGKEINKEMEHIIQKYHFRKLIRGKYKYDIKRIIQYAQKKMNKYKFNSYPSNTLLILEDFAGNPLIKKVDSPLAQYITKSRHYHLTTIIVAQKWRFIAINYKRLCSDLIIGKGYSMEDFQKIITQTPTSHNWKELWEQYKEMKSKHAKLVIHVNDAIEWIDE